MNFLLQKKKPNNIIQDSKSVGSDTAIVDDLPISSDPTKKGLSIGRVNASPSKLGMRSAARLVQAAASPTSPTPKKPYVATSKLANGGRVPHSGFASQTSGTLALAKQNRSTAQASNSTSAKTNAMQKS